MAPKGEASRRWEIIGKKGSTWQIRHINPYSDGQSRHWPGKPYQPSSEEKYLIQLARAWVKEDELEQPGKRYALECEDSIAPVHLARSFNSWSAPVFAL